MHPQAVAPSQHHDVALGVLLVERCDAEENRAVGAELRHLDDRVQVELQAPRLLIVGVLGLVVWVLEVGGVAAPLGTCGEQGTWDAGM
jgi:hypothetical protein